ncbi:MAG: thiol peroxidase [Spirochaetales bacterium]|nr:thiol peroxidase [Spirochaetales bacterium]
MKTVQFRDKSVNLVGRTIRKNMRAPEFILTTNDLDEIRLLDFNGKIKILTSFLSIDEEVCGKQVLEFEKRSARMPCDVAVIGISLDLPFTQKRFCRENVIEHMKLFSDYRYNSFGINYGLLIKEIHLLAGAVVVLDKNNNIRYLDILDKAAETPDYGLWFGELEGILSQPSIPFLKSMPYSCIPKGIDISLLDESSIERYMKEIDGWTLEHRRIMKTFEFRDFTEAKYFFDLVAVIAEEQGHYPEMKLTYDRLVVSFSTRAVNGLSVNDFVMASMIDGLML